MDVESKNPEMALPDLNSCEREPLHLLGTVEPNGVMLVLSEPPGRVLQASSNALSLLGITPEALVGMSPGDLFSPDDVQRLMAGSRDDGKRRYVGGLRTETGLKNFDALVHRNQGLLIIELEPGSPDVSRSSLQDFSTTLTDVMADLDGSLPFSELCQRVASSIRRITGFDRVMVYRFLEDDTGAVIAEDRQADLIPFLGLRYPASDIPAQARRLYLINPLRLKADVDARSATLNPVTGAPLDMTFCVLRAMSAVHVEYLRNMGVAASMSISIVKDGRLWGLIACHHNQPKLVRHQTRIACEALAHLFSSHIAAAEETDGRARADALHDIRGRIKASLATDREAGATLNRMASQLLAAIRAQGFTYSIRGKVVSFGTTGTTPDRPQTEALLAWLNVHQREHVFATDRLAALCPGATEFGDSACGILSMRVAMGAPDFVVWFRPAIVQEIAWAGNPDKPVEETEAGRRISPRRSLRTMETDIPGKVRAVGGHGTKIRVGAPSPDRRSAVPADEPGGRAAQCRVGQKQRRTGVIFLHGESRFAGACSHHSNLLAVAGSERRASYDDGVRRTDRDDREGRIADGRVYQRPAELLPTGRHGAA
jgi:light-regulated signal transduction histidine kinase (bacteriophytochrome)